MQPVQTQVQSHLPTCEFCGKRTAIKTDSQSRFMCRRCAEGGRVPIKSSGARVGRNESCPCGSGKKFKRCCKG